MSYTPLAMVPHVISMKLEGKASAEVALNSTHSPISHLPLSLYKTRARKNKREKMEIGDEGERWSGSKQAKIIISSSSSHPHLKPMVMVSS